MGLVPAWSFCKWICSLFQILTLRIGHFNANLCIFRFLSNSLFRFARNGFAAFLLTVVKIAMLECLIFSLTPPAINCTNQFPLYTDALNGKWKTSNTAKANANSCWVMENFMLSTEIKKQPTISPTNQLQKIPISDFLIDPIVYQKPL